MKKNALIFGITGQDGSLLARLLINKGYKVHGVKRRSSSFNTERVDDIFLKFGGKSFFLHYGDVTDSLNINSLIQKIKPDEVYNLAAQSHVKVSFETPEYTANADALGPLRILEAIKNIRKTKKIKFYQASTSEMFGNSKPPQDENTKLEPESPYGTAKVFGYWITRNYRDAYNIFACNGILFNHEGIYRGETFVTKKITRAVASIFLKKQKYLILGNLNSKRDWGDASEYVEAMFKMMQLHKPTDLVISTGKSYTVKQFVELAFDIIKIKIKWKGKGLNEVGYDSKNPKNILIKVSKKYYRPNEVNYLLGNPKNAKKIIEWKTKTNIKKLVKEMVLFDIDKLSKNIVD